MPRRSDLIFSKGGYAAKIAYPPLEMIPLRAMYQISGEEITIALRLLTVMHQDGNANFGNAIFSKASTILNIGETKLYELWAEWTKSEGKHIPQSFIKMPTLRKSVNIIQQFSSAIRVFIIKRKEAGRVIEVPDILMFLREVCIYIYIYICMLKYSSDIYIYMYIYISLSESKCYTNRYITIILNGNL